MISTYQAVENLPIAASLQKVQTLTYPKYAATLNFFCFLSGTHLSCRLRQRIAALEDSLAMTGFSVNHKLKSEVGAGLTLGIFEQLVE